MNTKQALRKRIINLLHAQGFDTSGKTLRHPAVEAGDKAAIRELQSSMCRDMLAKERPMLHPRQHDILARFASGHEVVPEKIEPRLVYAKQGSPEHDIVDYIRLSSSVPNAAPWARSYAVLVEDGYNGKVMGAAIMAAPLIAITGRDEWVGWEREDKTQRINNVAEGSTLVSVPPYSNLLAGKLIALAAVSNECRDGWNNRYDTQLALMTTMSAFGRSSVYNRLKYRDEKTFIPVGFTKGGGTFQFDHGDLISCIRDYVKLFKPGFDVGNRMHVVATGLSLLGLPSDWVYHGIYREIYVMPMASNAKDFLCGQTDVLDYIDRPFADVAAWWKERWAVPRAGRDPSYRERTPEDVRLWPDYEGLQASQLNLIDFPTSERSDPLEVVGKYTKPPKQSGDSGQLTLAI